MNQEILPFLLGLLVGMGWFVLIVPLVYRIWGISVPLNPLKRRRKNRSAGEDFLFDGLVAFGLPLFGCWGCGGFPAHGHIVRQPGLRTDGRGMSNDAGARQHPVPRARGRQ